MGIFIPGSSEKDYNFVEYNLPFEITQLKQLNDAAVNRRSFVYASRINRAVGIIEVSDTLSPKLISQITFDSYPENIYTADLNGDGKEEIMISGSGFDGISILFRKEKRLGEKKVANGSSFREAIFADLNNDDFPDVAAFNLIDNSLQFFYNDRKNNFRLVRSVHLDKGTADLLKTYDINKDGFADIIYSSGASLKVIFGDYQSSFKNSKTIELKTKPETICFADFNNDKFTDIAYLGLQTGTMNILFGKEPDEFYEEVIYAERKHFNSNSGNSITAITDFVIQKKSNLAYLTNGSILTIGDYNPNINLLKIVPAVNPGAIKNFDLDNDGILDFCFIDGSDNSLKIFQRNNEGTPVNIYSYLLDQDHDEILVDDFYNYRKTFYCYSKDSQLIEAFRINFKNGKYIHQRFYSPGKLKDVAIKRVDSTFVNIYMLYDKQNKLYPGKFEHRELSTTFNESHFIDRDVISAELLVQGNGSPSANYWKQTADSLFFNKAVIRNGTYIYKGFFGLPKYVKTSITLAAADKSYSDGYTMVTFFNSGLNVFAALFTGDSYKIVYPERSEFILDSLNYKQIFFSERPFGDRFGAAGIVIYLSKAGWFYKMHVSRNEKTYSLTPLVEARDAGDFFIERSDTRNSHLIYSNRKEGCISIILLTN